MGISVPFSFLFHVFGGTFSVLFVLFSFKFYCMFLHNICLLIRDKCLWVKLYILFLPNTLKGRTQLNHIIIVIIIIMFQF